ncbi:ParB/Srx family N-terminal domain-containing protein [Accumulibacter sp.]|uniref:ParB/Srx family N-terminal domain-containing protein n=1 Tax=Accumulibacter sp. TaxID=2053492 RepID=UPI002611428A|nr:ParB/Srx family N-terminal domain-containing protein [Accumulibacter sp.]
MRTITIMLSGLLMSGLAITATAGGGKGDWETRIPECGKNTKVVKLVDYDEESGASDGAPAKIVTFKEKKKKGCWIDIKDLHPTQSAVGMGAAACKSGKITAKAKAGKLEDYLLEDNRWVPLVRGPGGKFYLTDHHHLSTAVLNADIADKQKKLYAYLLKDWSNMKEDEFWKNMEKDNLTWLKNPQGQQISPKDLPPKISKLQDDPLRTLSAWIRGSCGYVKCNPPGVTDEDAEGTCSARLSDVECANAYFVEFKWAAYEATVPEVQAVVAAGASCPQQMPLNQECLDAQREKLANVLPAAMKAAAEPEAKAFVGRGAGYNPKPQSGVVPPCD